MTDDSKLFPIEPMPKLDKEQQEVKDLLDEKLNNSHKIDWNYWFSLPLWETEEAINLLSLFDPSIRDEDKKYLNLRPKYSIDGEVKGELNKKVTLAEREQQANILSKEVSPTEWVQWAMKKGYYIPTQLNQLKITIEAKQGSKLDVNNGDKPWLIPNSVDPEPAIEWYIPARYFARKLIRQDPLLLSKRLLLAEKVRKEFSAYQIYKRGAKHPPQAETILKAFTNVNFS